MRPQKLTVKNFMPFRSADGQAHEIDFTNLDLFAITGPMASGKSSLIDAIAWCLYGRTARYGADSKGVISAGEVLCEVTLDFTVGQQRFRAVRRTGKTTESGLSESEGDEWIQDESGSERLTARIEQLLGLDFDSFSKTVVLPQGRYAEFLSSEPSKRRELLEKILELGVYKRIADRAKEVETSAKARVETLRESLARPQYVGVNRAQIEQRREELNRAIQQLQTAEAQEEVLRGLAQQAEAFTTARARVTSMQADLQIRLQERETSRQNQETAEAQVKALAHSLAAVTAERDNVGYDARRHETIKRAVSHVHAYETARDEHARKDQALARIQQEGDALARQIVMQEQIVERTHRAYTERAAAVQQEIATSGDVATLTERLTDAKRWKEVHHEQARLTEQRTTLAQQLADAQQRAISLQQQVTRAEQQLQELRQQRDRARDEEHTQGRLELEAQHLGKELQDAAREEKRVTDAVTRLQAEIAAAELMVSQQRTVVTQAEHHEQAAFRALEESRQRHEAIHLRATLTIGSPCPVCQVPVQEVPRTAQIVQTDLVALQQAYETAKTAAAQATHRQQKAEATAATLGAQYQMMLQDLAARVQKRQEAQQHFVDRFPGFSSLSAALSGIQSQRQERGTRAKSLETEMQAAEKDKLQLEQQRGKVQQEDAKLNEALRRTTQQIEVATQHLSTLAATLTAVLATNEDPESLLSARRARLLQSEQEVKALEQAWRKEEQALSAQRTKHLQTEGQIGVLTTERNAAVSQAEREAQTARETLAVATDAPLPTLSVVRQQLEDLTHKEERYTALLRREAQLHQEREQAERHAIEVRAELQARSRAVAETQQAVQQAENTFAEARGVLQAALQQSALTDLGAEGEHLRARVDAMRRQLYALQEQRGRLEMEIADLERRCAEKEQEEEKLKAAANETRLAAELRKLLGAEFTDYLSEGAVKALMYDASAHLQKLTHGRYSFRIDYKPGKRGAIELLIVDHEDSQRARPTHSLSGGETFLASLAIALALSQSFREVATGRAAKTSTECLILDEGFGTLDREGVQLVTETLQELRGEEGRMVGIITHVEEVAAAMPMRIEVRKGNRTSTVTVSG